MFANTFTNIFWLVFHWYFSCDNVWPLISLNEDMPIYRYANTDMPKPISSCPTPLYRYWPNSLENRKRSLTLTLSIICVFDSSSYIWHYNAMMWAQYKVPSVLNIFLNALMTYHFHHYQYIQRWYIQKKSYLPFALVKSIFKGKCLPLV